MTLSERVNDCFNREAWQEARAIILRAMKRTPDDHWLLSRLGTTYYEERDYQRALEISRRAAKQDPTCPLVLWDLACTLDAVGDKEQAIKIYEKLLARGIDGIANDECGEGEEWARSLLTDCKFRTALCYADEYLADVRAGVVSIYLPKHEAAHLSAERFITRIGTPMVSGHPTAAIPFGTAANTSVKSLTFSSSPIELHSGQYWSDIPHLLAPTSPCPGLPIFGLTGLEARSSVATDSAESAR